VVEADDTLRRGVVAMSQAFGGQPDEDHRYRELGTNTNRLISAEDDFDELTGIPAWVPCRSQCRVSKWPGRHRR